MVDRMPLGPQHRQHLGHDGEGAVEGPEIGDLRADMHVDAGHRDAGQGRRLGIDVAGAPDRDAELVLGLAGRDLGVGAGIDVGIEAERDPRRRPFDVGEPGQSQEFRLGFDVEAVDAFVERQRQLGFGLADAREGDPAGPARRRRGRGATRPRTPRPSRRRGRRRAAARPDWNWPSWRSRRGSRAARSSPRRPRYCAVMAARE